MKFLAVVGAPSAVLSGVSAFLALPAALLGKIYVSPLYLINAESPCIYGVLNFTKLDYA